MINATPPSSDQLHAVLQNVGIMAFIGITFNYMECKSILPLISKLFNAISLEGQLLNRETNLPNLIFKEFGEQNER